MLQRPWLYKRTNKCRHFYLGFTWWELLVVICTISLLVMIALPNFLNTTYKDGPTWVMGRYLGRSIHHQLQHFKVHQTFSPDLNKFKPLPNDPMLGEANYTFEAEQHEDLIVYRAKAKQQKMKVIQTLGPFIWYQESSHSLYSLNAAIAIGRSQEDNKKPKTLDIVYCSAMTPGDVMLSALNIQNGILVCGQGTNRIAGSFYQLDKDLLP
jgi:competence protein ComGC